MSRELPAPKMAQFTQLIEKISARKDSGEWVAANALVGGAIDELLGGNPAEYRKLTEGELLNRLRTDPMSRTRMPYRQMMLVALLKEAGDVAVRLEPARGGGAWYLKALHILLDALSQSDLRDYAALAPSVEELLGALDHLAMPKRTRAALMREYVRRGCGAESREIRMAFERGFDPV